MKTGRRRALGHSRGLPAAVALYIEDSQAAVSGYQVVG
jgi:hypothetical protein